MAVTDSPSALIDHRIAALADWRGEARARVRALIRQALADVVDAWKWDVPTRKVKGAR